MLQFIRSKVGSIFIKFLFVVLIASFAVWGIGDIFLGSPGGRAAIKVDNIQVTSVEVIRDFERVMRRLNLQITPREAARYGFLDQVIDDIVTDRLIMAEADDLGISVSDGMVSQRISEVPQFRDQFNQFSREAFQRVLYNAGLNEEAFIARMRNELRREQFVDALLAGVNAPAAMNDTLYRYRQERRTVDALNIPVTTITDIAEPNSSDLQEFYNENEGQYQAPEYRGVSYISLSPDEMAKDIAVSDEDARQEYEASLDRYTVQEVRDVQQIIFAGEDEAAAAAKRLATGEDFLAVAKDLTGADEGAVNLGKITRNDLFDGTVDAVFSAAKDVATAPVKSDLGWHIFKITDISPEEVKSFEEVKDQVALEVARNQALDSIFELANQLEDELAGGSSLEEAGKALSLTVHTKDQLDNTGKDRAGAAVSGLPQGQAFLAAAFSTNEGEESQLGETNDSGYFILRVDDVVDAATRPFDEVEQSVRAAWLEQERQDKAAEIADEIVEKTKSGKSLSELATEYGYPLTSIPSFSRTGEGIPQGFPTDLAAVAFEMKVDDVDVASSNVVFSVARLTEIIAAEAGQADVAEQIAEQATSNLQASVFDALVTALRESHEVTVDRDYIDAQFREN